MSAFISTFCLCSVCVCVCVRFASLQPYKRIYDIYVHKNYERCKCKVINYLSYSTFGAGPIYWLFDINTTTDQITFISVPFRFRSVWSNVIVCYLGSVLIFCWFVFGPSCGLIAEAFDDLRLLHGIRRGHFDAAKKRIDTPQNVPEAVAKSG